MAGAFTAASSPCAAASGLARDAGPWRALPPLPDWDAPPRPPQPANRVGEAVAALLGQLSPTLDGEALAAHVREVVEREVVAILWEVVPKLAERHLVAAKSRTPGAGSRAGLAAPPGGRQLT